MGSETLEHPNISYNHSLCRLGSFLVNLRLGNPCNSFKFISRNLLGFSSSIVLSALVQEDHSHDLQLYKHCHNVSLDIPYKLQPKPHYNYLTCLRHHLQ